MNTKALSNILEYLEKFLVDNVNNMIALDYIAIKDVIAAIKKLKGRYAANDIDEAKVNETIETAENINDIEQIENAKVIQQWTFNE